MSTVDAWRIGVRGKSLWEFIVFRARKESDAVVRGSLATFMSSLPAPAADAFERYVTGIVAEARSGPFWQQDCATFLDRVLRELDEEVGSQWPFHDDDHRFAAFEAVSSHLVNSVRTESPHKAAMQSAVRGSFPYSVLFLLIPLFMTWQMWSDSSGEAGSLLLMGYFLTQCGYVVLAAGVLAGSFRGFHLSTRRSTLVAGACLVGLGIVMVNMG